MRAPSATHQENNDDAEKQETRGGTPFYMHNRKDRRKLAKSFKLFMNIIKAAAITTSC